MLQSQKKMRQEKTVLSDSQVAELRLVYKTMTIEQLCARFHVGTVRLYEILREHGMDDRMPMKRRKTEVINDAQVRKEPKPKCAYCKRFSSSGGVMQEGWCMKFRKRVRKSGWCSEFLPPQDGQFVKVIHPS